MEILTVTITDTMIIRILAMPDMIASMAPPMADTIAPCPEENEHDDY